MSTQTSSSDAKLRQLDEALRGLERSETPPVDSTPPKSEPAAEIGPKTKLAVRVMAWGIGLFWILWIIFAFVVSPPRQMIDLLAVPFSALICWLIFQGHRAIWVGLARKLSRSAADREVDKPLA